jgi:hypothetical protein
VLQKGYVRLPYARFALRLHLTIPLAFLFVSGFAVAPAAWLGVATILAVHIAGHRLFALLAGTRVIGIDVHALGGHCHLAAASSKKQKMFVACGGVALQLALYLAFAYVVPPHFGTAFAEVMVGANVWILALNCLPIPPLDGGTVWSLPRTIAGMFDDAPDSLDRPQRANPDPPKRDWFARTRERSLRSVAAEEAAKLEKLDEAELDPEAAAVVDRLVARVDRVRERS